MANLLSSSSFTYDVCLANCGDDTTNDFTRNLSKALSDRGINTFVHEENSNDALKAMEGSRVMIIIFSENFGVLSYDLPYIRETHNDEFIYPVFYNTNPTHLRSTCSDFYCPNELDAKEFLDGEVWWGSIDAVAVLPGWSFKFNDGEGNEFEFIDKIVQDVYRMQLNGVPPLHTTFWREILKVYPISQIHKVASVMMSISLMVFQAETTWRVVGFMSCIVGFLCYALSPSFNRLFGRWNPFKVFLYVVLSLAILTTIIFAKQASPSTRHVQLKKTCITFLVLMIISVYSFFYDRAVNGKPNILSVISNAAFSLVSLSLHILLKVGVEMGVFSYFVGCFTIQLLAINWKFNFIAIIFGFLFFLIHSTLNSQPNVAIGRQDNQV